MHKISLTGGNNKGRQYKAGDSEMVISDNVTGTAQ